MNRLVQSTLLAVIGFIAGAATLNGVFLNFVKPGLRWPLLLACAVLVLLGAYGGVFEDDEDSDDKDDNDDNEDKARKGYAEPCAVEVAQSSERVKELEPAQGHQRGGQAGFAPEHFASSEHLRRRPTSPPRPRSADGPP